MHQRLRHLDPVWIHAGSLHLELVVIENITIVLFLLFLQGRYAVRISGNESIEQLWLNARIAVFIQEQLSRRYLAVPEPSWPQLLHPVDLLILIKLALVLLLPRLVMLWAVALRDGFNLQRALTCSPRSDACFVNNGASRLYV